MPKRRAIITDDDAYLMRRVKAKLEPSESQSQRALIKWWSHACRGFGLHEKTLMAFPMQGARTPRNGARMKAEGMRAGLPDCLVAVARSNYHGLWIENKTSKGQLSESQQEMRDILIKQGYAWFLCRSLDEAINTITTYLS